MALKVKFRTDLTKIAEASSYPAAKVYPTVDDVTYAAVSDYRIAAIARVDGEADDNYYNVHAKSLPDANDIKRGHVVTDLALENGNPATKLQAFKTQKQGRDDRRELSDVPDEEKNVCTHAEGSARHTVDDVFPEIGDSNLVIQLTVPRLEQILAAVSSPYSNSVNLIIPDPSPFAPRLESDGNTIELFKRLIGRFYSTAGDERIEAATRMAEAFDVILDDLTRVMHFNLPGRRPNRTPHGAIAVQGVHGIGCISDSTYEADRAVKKYQETLADFRRVKSGVSMPKPTTPPSITPVTPEAEDVPEVVPTYKSTADAILRDLGESGADSVPDEEIDLDDIPDLDDVMAEMEAEEIEKTL